MVTKSGPLIEIPRKCAVNAPWPGATPGGGGVCPDRTMRRRHQFRDREVWIDRREPRASEHVIDAATAVNAQRFIHISSISVLPADQPSVDEMAAAVNHPWKGSYSRVKADAEHVLLQRWSSSPLLMVRSGFILATGLVDSIVGIGMPLPYRTDPRLGRRADRHPADYTRRRSRSDREAGYLAIKWRCQQKLHARRTGCANKTRVS